VATHEPRWQSAVRPQQFVRQLQVPRTPSHARSLAPSVHRHEQCVVPLHL